MKTTRKTIVMSVATVLAMLAVIFGAFAPTVTAAAQGTTPPSGEAVRQKLADRYQRELHWLNIQATNLSKADEVSAKVQNLINAAQARGLDVTGLVNTLNKFNTDIANAQLMHDNAANVLNAHNGFDASGNVTDITAARQTLQDARSNLKNAHDSLIAAFHDLRTAIDAWRDAHVKK
jgi:alpha-L-arabinofuranosidase